MSGRNQQNEDVSDDEMEVDNAGDIACDSDEEGGLRIDEEIYIPPPPRKITELQQGERLMITKIVNHDFKSYAGEVVIGPFHQCFSAIVGPNGSGKSNVIDSMLFVFGYRASKIRSKKISVLIHNSSEHPECRSCTVAVHFQKVIDTADGGYEVVSNSKLVISRTAFKDSSSFYELNGKKVQFKVIAKILRAEGVDLDHNRFLILQGEVEQISLMKPKAQNEHESGLLEFLEDIIGTSRYKEPLEKLMEKVDILSEQVAEKANRLRIVEKERDEMKEPMEEAIGYLKIENTITKLQYKLCHCKKADCNAEINEKTNSKNELQQDHEKLNEELKQIHDDKNSKNSEMKEKCTKWDAIQQKMDAVTTKFEEIKKTDEALHEELVETNKRRKTHTATLKTMNIQLAELKKVPEKNETDIKHFEKLIVRQTATQEKEEAELQVLMENVQQKTEPLIKKRTNLETKLISLRKNVNDAKAAFDLAESEVKIYTTVEKTENDKLLKLKEALQNTAETLKDRKEQLESFEKKIPATEKSLQQARQELEQIKRREQEVNARLKDARGAFEEKRSAMTASRSRNQVINALMEEKRRGRLPGIFGRLGDLGAIDAQYDVAISTACGPLDNVVVDTVDTAQACIEFLRTNNIGRATFIPLEKQQRFLSQCNKKINTPENVPRLFDMIKVEDKRVLPAFYYGLHDTLVATNLNQATRIAYGARRNRVVTLQGELIETSGTMSGGGRTVLRGRMGTSVVRSEPSAADIEKLQANLDQLFLESNELRNQQPPLENQIQTLSAALKDMITKRDRYQLEVTNLKEQAPSLKNQVKAQEKKAASAKSNPARVKELTKIVDDAEKELKKVQSFSQSTEDSVKQISEEIDNITGGKIKEQQKKISEAKKLLDKSKNEICRLQVATKTSIRNVEKTEKTIEKLESDIKACETRIKEGQQEKRDLEEAAKGVIEKIDKYKELLKERDESLLSLKTEIDAIQKKETKLKATKIDLDQKLSEIKKQLAELANKNHEYERRIRSLKLNEIPTQPVEELIELCDEEISRLDARTIAANLAAAKERLPENIPNMQIIKEFLEKDKVYLQRCAVVEEITQERNKMRSAYDLVKKRRTDEFYAGFYVITTKLKEMYQMITLGGAAELELVDSMDPFSEGIVFTVRPPKKSWKNISNLSGGEKTLSSLALVFALHHYKPTPLYFMDEIDAALDFKNVSIVGTYIKERTKNAQFIVISLRSEMFELADTLVGIYKTYNATKTATINIKSLYQKHPKIADQEKKRKERYSVTSKTSSSQAFSKTCSQRPRPKTPVAFPLIPSTCPAQINGRKSKSPEPEANITTENTPSTPVSINQVPRRRSLRRSASVLSDSDTPVKSNGIGRSNPKRRKL